MPAVADAGAGPELARQVLHADGGLAPPQDHGPLQHVPHLAHVARPGVAEQALERLGREGRRRIGELGAEVAHEPGEKREPVLPRPLPHRGKRERHDAQPVVEVLPEPARLHLRLEVLVGGRDQPHVHRDLAGPAQPAEGLGLQHLEQLGLELGGEVADLVQEDGPPVGDLEQALLAVLGVGEGPLLVPEQLGVEERGVEPGAVHLHEGRLGPGAQVVDHPGHPPLPGPALAGEEHGGPVALGQERHLVPELLHGGGGAQGVEAVAGGGLPEQRLVHPAEADLVGHPGGRRGQVGHVHRLGQEVLRPELHGPDRGGNVAVAGE